MQIYRADTTKPTLAALVRLHRDEIKFGFLSSLGDEAINLLFSFSARSKSAILLVARDPTTLIIHGFLLGTFDTSRFYRDFLKKNIFQSFFYVGPRLLTLQRVRKIIETLLYPSKKEIRELPSPEILDLVVGRNSQGMGVGRALFTEFTNILKESGSNEFKITTGESLSGAHAFYEKMGATHVRNINIHVGQSTRVYLYKIIR
jgi:GNAT superfamily N-acetyltransferase